MFTFERFLVDSNGQKVYLKPSDQIEISNQKLNTNYYLTIICKDNEGNGNVAVSSLEVNFKNSVQSQIDREYYLLATGPDGTDIPYLSFKVS